MEEKWTFPILYKNVNLNDILLSNLIINNKKKMIYIFYKNKYNNFYLQTPELIHLIDLNYNEKKNYYELYLPLYNKEHKENINEFKKILNNVDEKICEEAKKNYSDWFYCLKQKKIIDNVNFSSTIKFSHDSSLKKYENIIENGILKLKIFNDTKIFHNNKCNNEEKKIKDIIIGWKLRIILEFVGIWFSSDNLNFGIYLKPIIIEFKNILNFKFIDEFNNSDNEDEINDTINNDNNNNVKLNNWLIKYEKNNNNNNNIIEWYISDC